MKYYSIGKFAKLLNITVQTLRNWDKDGTLKPHHLGKNNHRYYSEEQANKILFGTKTKNRNRANQIKFYLSDTEKEKLEKKIKKSKLNKSEYLRRSSLEKDIIVIDGIKNLTLELNKIGNNINQLTKLVHQGLVDDTRVLEKYKQNYNVIMSEILITLKKVK